MFEELRFTSKIYVMVSRGYRYYVLKIPSELVEAYGLDKEENRNKKYLIIMKPYEEGGKKS